MAVTITNNNMTPSLDRIVRELKKLPREAYGVFVEATPKKSGNARRKTQLKGSTIHANYAYASRLDDGISRQAPDGMTKPTERFIQERTDRIMRK